MYEAYWGFTELPFLKHGNRPVSRMHEEAMCRIDFLMQANHPIALLSGKKGTGKSSLLQKLKNQWKKKNEFTTFSIDFDKIAIHEVGASLLAQSSCADFSDEPQENAWTIFQKCLRARKQKRALAIFDHISVRNDEAFGIVRYLYDLAQQPDVPLSLIVAIDSCSEDEIERSKLDRYLDLSPLQNELEFLSQVDAIQYIRNTLERTGVKRSIFDELSLKAVFKSTGGNIGRINQLCDVCLLAGMLDRRKAINPVIVHAAAAELWPEEYLKYQSTKNSNRSIDDVVYPEDVSQGLD